MPLKVGRNNSSGAILKCDGRTGLWRFRAEDGEETPLDKPSFVLDYPNIRTGWICFSEGSAPLRRIDPDQDNRAPKPDDGADYRRGFAVRVFLVQHGMAEFSAVAMGIVMAVEDLSIEIEAEQKKRDNKGKLPLIKVTGATSTKTGRGTSFKPISGSIDGWRARRSCPTPRRSATMRSIARPARTSARPLRQSPGAA